MRTTETGTLRVPTLFADLSVVDLPFGNRPFRVHVDPSQDGAEIVNAVADRMRREIYRNIGLADLLSPRING